MSRAGRPRIRERVASGADDHPAMSHRQYLPVTTLPTPSRAKLRRLKREHPNAGGGRGCSAEINPTPSAFATFRSQHGQSRSCGLRAAHRGLFPPILTEDAVPQRANGRLPSLVETRSLLMIQDCARNDDLLHYPTARPVVSATRRNVWREASPWPIRAQEKCADRISIGPGVMKPRLSSLLKAMAETAGIERIRLSSIEPRTVTIPC